MRAQRVKQVNSLKDKGLSSRQIATESGLSVSYVRELFYDPNGAKAKARKDSYRGICKICGSHTDGSNGKNAPEYCVKHASRAYNLVWSESKIVAAIREWHFIYGETPVASDWNRRVEGSPRQYTGGSCASWTSKRRWPTLIAVQRTFGSWANAIEAAGFPRPKVGHYRDESKRSEIQIRLTAPVILEWIREHAEGSQAPTRKGAPIKAAIREFGSWAGAIKAAGFEPRRGGRVARSTH